MRADAGNQAVILTYHSISDDGPPLAIPPGVFAEQMEWLKRTAHVVPLTELVGLLEERAPLPARAVALTFDDGLSDFASRAAPVLRQHALPATVFVPTGWCGLSDGWHIQPARRAAKKLMPWTEIRALADGGVEFGSHTVSHARLSAFTQSEIDRELADSKRHLEREVGRPVNLFAYPYGDWTPAVRESVRRQYRAACTADLAGVRSDADPCSLPRIDVHYLRSPNRFRSMFTGRMQMYLRLRRVGRTCRRALAK